ncbi:MAG: type II toxin-antitoxin system VapC family toxin [Rhodoferax sp.]|nr:type II toxin-antitoxin system VapC family toxin [Rhodoferax sp.]MCF8208813.1 type II toxin-antitoxin system VapC family toxin [Rhodoferax sp.]
MKPPILLDASAILAFLQGEPGEDTVRRALQASPCWVSAANQAEIISKALDRGGSKETIERILKELQYTVAEVLAEDGAQAGWLRATTRHLGLSLGDRLCLATAQRLKSQVLTADRDWLKLATVLGLDIVCIRPETH